MIERPTDTALVLLVPDQGAVYVYAKEWPLLG